MSFHDVSIVGLAHVDAPHRITSAEIDARLAPAFERLGMRPGLLENTAGIVARRFWDPGVMPSDAATWAAERAIEGAGVDRERIGVVINTSVCRDYVEPSTACIVHGNLKLSRRCLNFDVGNACLAFLNGMDIAARMLEARAVEYALIVDGEGSRHVTERTIDRMLQDDCSAAEARSQFAALTLGSGGAAMVLARTSDRPDGHRYLGGVTLAASEHNRLCVGHTDRMDTDTKALLFAGIELAGYTLERARAEMGWSVDALDELVIHQVSRVHTEGLAAALGLDTAKILRVYEEFGNVGPAGVPFVLSKAAEAGRLHLGHRVALMGIGSGLNCAMAEVVW